MSLVETVRPKKVPFPVGAACARRSRAEEEFKGGQIPIEKYPLVSKPPPYVDKVGPMVMSRSEWSELSRLISTSAAEASSSAEAMEERDRRLAEASEQLKRSWGETGKKKTDLIREALAESARAREAEDRRAAERIAREKEEERAAAVRAATEAMRRAEAEENLAVVDRALLLSETLAENGRILALRRRRRDEERRVEEEVERRCAQEWDRYEQELADRARDQKEEYVAMETFQRRQMEEKAMRRQREKEESLARRRQAEDYSLKLTSLARHQSRERRRRLEEDLKGERESLQEERRRRRERIEELERAEMEMAKKQELEFARRNEEYEREFRQRTIDIGKRQEAARKWIRENVIPEREERFRRGDENIKVARAYEAARERQRLEKVSEHRQRRVGEVEAFLRDHVARRREEEAARRAALAAEAAADAERAEEHLRRVEAARQEEEWSRGAHVNFWTNQKGETEREKKEEFDADVRIQRAAKEHEESLRRSVAARARDVANHQRAKGGRDLERPLERAAAELELGWGTEVTGAAVAADGSEIRVVGRKVGGGRHPKPEENRERMSLNWTEAEEEAKEISSGHLCN